MEGHLRCSSSYLLPRHEHDRSSLWVISLCPAGASGGNEGRALPASVPSRSSVSVHKEEAGKDRIRRRWGGAIAVQKYPTLTINVPAEKGFLCS